VKAAFIKKYNRVKLVDIPKPSPSGKEVLVKVQACGVCGSDFIEAKAWAKQWKRFGHEIVGTVEEMGPEVTGFSEGDQVVIALSAPCGVCPACKSGVPRRCSNLIMAEQGGFAEYLLVPDQRLLYHVKPSLPIRTAVMAEPITVVLDAFEAASLQEGQYFLVVGGGYIGRLALLTAKTEGANVLGILGRKTSPQIEECLKDTGGEHFSWRTWFGRTIGPPTDLRERLSTLPGSLVILHTAPAYYIGNYLEAMPFGTTIVNIGLSAKPRENKLRIDGSKLIFSKIQLLSAFPVPCLHMEHAVDLLQSHVELYGLMTMESRTIDDLPGVIGGSYNHGAKVVILP
jgi:D-arabinose 1-dehydrogenase-like Zn-dependent alcohol dehydrogenase